MKWLNKLGIPAKLTIIFVLGVYLPLIIAGYCGFLFSQKEELRNAIETYGLMAEMEKNDLSHQFDRIISEIKILGESKPLKDILRLYEKNLHLDYEKLLKVETLKEDLAFIDSRSKVILASNPNLFGMAISVIKKPYEKYQILMAINEDKTSHEITIKKAFYIDVAHLKDFFNSEQILFHGNKSAIFPFNEKDKEVMDSVLLYKGKIGANSDSQYIIAFYFNAFFNKAYATKENLTNLDRKFTLYLAQDNSGKISLFNPQYIYNDFYIDWIDKKLPKTFLNLEKGEFTDNNGNIFFIRKINLNYPNLAKLVMVSFFPRDLIRKPFTNVRNQATKSLALISLIIIPFIFFAIKTLTLRLKGITKNLNNTSSTLETSIDGILKTSSIIKNSNKDNKIAINEISSKMESYIGSNKNFINEVAFMRMLSKETSNSAIEGRNDLNDLAISMDQVIESSKSIYKILNIIENISTQTNILSMNASVEAARAGEHGKGFAVVAEAIRNLAQKSSQSAAEIGNQIQDSIKVSEKGSQKAAQNRAKFNNIIENISKLNDIINAASTNLSQRIDDFTKVGDALNKINLAVSEGSLQTEKHEDIALKLSTEADSLRESIKEILALVEGAKKNENTAS